MCPPEDTVSWRTRYADMSRLAALGAYPETQAGNMVDYYERGKRKMLQL
jgi:hypothetical protein